MIIKFILLIGFASNLLANDLDSLENVQSNTHFKSNYIVPISLMSAGLILNFKNGVFDKYTVQDEVLSHNFARNRFDDYLQFAPGAFLLAFDLLDMDTKNTFIDQSILLTESVFVAIIITQSLKYSTQIERPDKSNKLSFPSGHTAFAFTLASVLSKEMGDKNIYFSILSYSIASSVGILRITNNKHYLSDVLFGAGIGIISTNLVYDFNESFKYGLNKLSLYPQLSYNYYGLNLIYSL